MSKKGNKPNIILPILNICRFVSCRRITKTKALLRLHRQRRQQCNERAEQLHREAQQPHREAQQPHREPEVRINFFLQQKLICSNPFMKELKMMHRQ